MRKCVKIVMVSGRTYFIIYDKVVMDDGLEYFYNTLNDEEICFFRANSSQVESVISLKDVREDNSDNWVRIIG